MSDDQDEKTEGDSARQKVKDARRASVDKASRRSGNHTQAILNDEIEILPDKRLIHLDQGPVQAFAARPVSDTAGPGYFALVCDTSLVPRVRHAPQIAGIISPSFARLIASGVCYWPPGQSERYVFVYENNLGQPIMKPGEPGLGWKPDFVMNVVIKPVVNVLLDLRDSDVYHGGIRPTNMFDGGVKQLERILLGDCLATPPSYNQPALYEPAERAMADPIARGRGTHEDDLYAFGVSLAVILRHKDPLEGMSADDVIRMKIEQGSYTALTGSERFTGALLELLRGLLYDEQGSRWTLDEVTNWLDGQRLSPKQASRKIKAARPLAYAGEKYFRPTLLAMDIYKNQSEAIQMIENDTLGQWLERSLEDKPATARMEEAIASAQEGGRGSGYWDRLLARASVALDPAAPLRFRGMAIGADGFGAALAEAMIKKKDVQPFIDIINQQLMMYWVTTQNDSHVDIAAIVTRFDSCRGFLRQPTMGYGIERCLYYLCPEAPCISDILKGYYVRSPEDLLFALEEIARKPQKPHLLIDRHIAAYLSVKDRRVIDPILAELNAAEFHRRIIGNLSILASVQKRSRMENMPGIASWAADVLKPVYERIHDRDLREKLKASIAKAAESGDLSRMVVIIDDPQMRQQDMAAFKAAMRDYNNLRAELGKLEGELSKPKSFGRETGQQYAAVASAIIAGIVMLAVAFMYISHGGHIGGTP
jgi:hypothetical protein